MTILIEGQKSFYLTTQASILGDRELADSNWAGKHIQQNSALKWILGRYVEANAANSNRQAFALEDLRIAQPTIMHAPLNLIHQARHIVGTFVASEMLYPTDENSIIANPHIEALAVFWAAYFSEELKLIQEAHDEGSLFFSMECVSDEVRFVDTATDSTETFLYAGPKHESYGSWNTNTNAVRYLDKPHFLAGALIFPPVSPGWKSAQIKSLANNEQLSQQILNSAPHLTSEQVENVTIGLLYTENEEKSSIKNTVVPIIIERKTNSNEHTLEPSLERGNMSEKTFSEDELKAAIAVAVEAANSELTALKAQANTNAIEVQISELKAAHENEIAEIKRNLDEKLIEAQSSKADFDNIVAWLEGEKISAAEKAEQDSRKDSRLATIAEVVSFPDEYVAANTDRWTAMSDEDFLGLIEGYRITVETAKSTSKEAGKTASLARETAMEQRDEKHASNSMDDVRSVLRLRRDGIDARLIN